ncbi:hypothetical protein Poly51_15940 [Rubripirellula tenax]|uniref:Transmembrane protein n=1 Tax=Rubripirellula tenax TaxID=2528015 RepID=A0A5C6FF40_9BACT|nr:hypothetical protein [Rubripirellula tenax]TWU58814.1 hypothetical protein Poly51_15940 [Rubripirellula tenax]
MLDRKTIESTLQQIRDGELSTDEATDFLLELDSAAVHDSPTATSNDPHAESESIASIVARLGPPPAEIVETWRRQLISIAAEHESETGQPIAGIESADCQLISDGRLMWKGHVAMPPASDAPAISISQVSRDSVEAFGRPWHAESDFKRVEIENPEAEADAEQLEPSSPKPSSPKPDAPRPATRDPKPPTGVGKRWFVRAATAAALLACIAASYFIVNSAMKPETVAVKSSKSAAARKTPPRNTVDIFDFSSEPTAEDLETFESMTESELATLERETQVEMEADAKSLSLDAFMPATAMFSPASNSNTSNSNEASITNPALAPEPPEESVTDETRANTDTPAAMHTADLDSDDGTAPPESEQQTVVAPSAGSVAVAIERTPTISEVDSVAPFSIGPRLGESLSLDFPYDVPLKMETVGDETYNIVDTRKANAIATLTSTDDGLTMAWTAPSATSSSASMIVHGRLKDGSGGSLFLRPVVEAEPFRLRLDTPDSMPTWNLEAPIPPRVAKISVDIELPKDVEITWAETIQPDQIRRARGMAVLMYQDNENVALGVRMDIRCSRKLQCRMRFAGRLDSSMPWNIVSRSGLETFADQLAYQSELVAREATRLDGVYEIANSLGRRVIKMKQTRNDALAENIRTTLRRVAELESLVAAVELEAKLKLRVWIDWPDTQQTILTMD